MASRVLDLLAVVIVVAGAIVALLGLVAMAEVGFVYGLVVFVSAVVATATNWGILTTASVVAGYVANRSS